MDNPLKTVGVWTAITALALTMLAGLVVAAKQIPASAFPPSPSTALAGPSRQGDKAPLVLSPHKGK